MQVMTSKQGVQKSIEALPGEAGIEQADAGQTVTQEVSGSPLTLRSPSL